MFKKSLAVMLTFSGSLLAAPWLSAQESSSLTAQPAASRDPGPSVGQEIAMLRSDLRARRKAIVAANMQLSDAEAEKFWPIYDQYVNELVKTNDAKYMLIKQYLENTNMTDEQADNLSKRWVQVDTSVAELRLKYIPIFRAALSARGTAMFFQIDRRVQLMIDLQLASSIPLVQP